MAARRTSAVASTGHPLKLVLPANPITQDMGVRLPRGADSLPDPLVRAEHYRVLAAAFAYPDAEELATLLAEAEQAATAAGQSELASFSRCALDRGRAGLGGRVQPAVRAVGGL